MALAFTDRYAAVNAIPSRVNALAIYVTGSSFGSLVLCDGTAYDINGYTTPAADCGPHDGDNNLHLIAIAPNTVSGQFQVHVHARDIPMKAVPGLDAGPNQDWAAIATNAQ